MEQSGPGIQALAIPPIIHYSTAGRPLTRLRDSALFLLCWMMWTVVATAVINSTEWEDIGNSIAGWFGAHLVFFHVLMASFHFPDGYVPALIILVCAFMIWSNLGMLPGMRRRDAVVRKSALSQEELVLHFGLDCALIGLMQKEKQVIVFHASGGAVIGVRRASAEATAPTEAAALHLVV